MSSKDELIIWQEGVNAFDRHQDEKALQIFQSMTSSSKVHFNIAVIYIKQEDWFNAIQSLTRAISHDSYFAVAYFVRGNCEFQRKFYQEAYKDYQEAIEYLRGNDYIDYNQLGLHFNLKRLYIEHNMGLCYFKLGRSAEASGIFRSLERNVHHDDPFYIQLLDSCRGSSSDDDIIELGDSLIFRPAESKIQNIEQVDYLGSSTVVASVNAGDTYTGFSGTLLKNNGTNKKKMEGSSPKIGYASDDPPTPTWSLKGSPIPTFSEPPRSIMSKPKVTSIKIRETTLNSDERESASPYTQIQITQRKSSLMDNIFTNTRPSPSSSSFGSPTLLRSASETSSQFSHTDAFNRKKLPESPLSPPTPSSARRLLNDSSGQIHVKLHFKETRMILLPYTANFTTLREKVKTKMKIEGDFALKYKDDDAELCLLQDDEDLQLAMMHAGIDLNLANNKGGDRMELWCSLKNQ